MARRSPNASARRAPFVPPSVLVPNIESSAAPHALAPAAPPAPPTLSGTRTALTTRRDPASAIAERLKRPPGLRAWSREEQLFVEQRSGQCD